MRSELVIDALRMAARNYCLELSAIFHADLRLAISQSRADKAYSSRDIPAYLRRRRIRATIPERSNQQQTHRGRCGGRPPTFDPVDYKQRNTVERAINKWLPRRCCWWASGVDTGPVY